jgi:hypothetical protein
MQLQKIKEFLQQKASQYKIPVESVVGRANFVRFTPLICNCSECQQFADLSVSNSIRHPAELFLLVEQAIAALNIAAITEKIQHFHQVKCSQAKNILASSILDMSFSNLTTEKSIFFFKTSFP